MNPYETFFPVMCTNFSVVSTSPTHFSTHFSIVSKWFLALGGWNMVKPREMGTGKFFECLYANVLLLISRQRI